MREKNYNGDYLDLSCFVKIQNGVLFGVIFKSLYSFIIAETEVKTINIYHVKFFVNIA